MPAIGQDWSHYELNFRVEILGKTNSEEAMMVLGRPIPPLTLNLNERETLTSWAHCLSCPQSLAARARMILACTEGKTNTEVAKEIRTTKQTVGKWRSRFLTLRTDGLFDEPRPGAPRRGGGTHFLQAGSVHLQDETSEQRCGISRKTVMKL